ncbi:MAG TPA: GNAT family N-acetyltransferase [Blastocatellia bacterium]|nr:GNAT family N-acetyltransferase [Blastocatellia bacterium]
MYPLIEIKASRMDAPDFPATQSEPLIVEELRAEQEAEVLEFLGERPSHTFGMTGFIRTNGLVSPHNFGAFYACRDKRGQLQGVALIGRYILLETRSDAAIEAFARLAQACRNAHMLLGEQETVETFWHYYGDGGQAARLYCRELLLEQRCPVQVWEAVPGLRLATLDDLDLVVPAHAQTAFDESGIDPLEENPEVFRNRCARRIEQGQTWVWVEEGRLMFKAEVLTNTPEVAYLEGVWVGPAERGKGVGRRCLSQLTRHLLANTRSVCLLVNERFRAAQHFYKKAGYKFISHYDTIFLSPEAH